MHASMISEKMSGIERAPSCRSSSADFVAEYQNAVECLAQCESIIKALQDQLKSKDKQIACLEGRLVQMSLELASSKALEDEHRQLLKRRTMNYSDESSHSSQTGNKIQEASVLRSLASETARARRPSRTPRPAVSQSWSVHSKHAASANLVPSTISINEEAKDKISRYHSMEIHQRISSRRGSAPTSRPRRVKSLILAIFLG